ncbi:unnamed protein product [Bursaphelenchus xylophilus]|nr:unnamed protein product [Bursaphelenchus xylophilus]CAG9124081.1 unnamed protein product [Bursaphelenchus xylophilus]
MTVEMTPDVNIAPTFDVKADKPKSLEKRVQVNKMTVSLSLTLVMIFTVYWREIKEFVKTFDPFLGSRLVFYEGAGGQKWTVPHSTYTYSFKASFENFKSNEWAVNFMKRYWLISIPLAYFYYYGIHRLQDFMKNREPMKLTKTLVAWNIFLGLFSIVGFVRTFEEWFYVIRNDGIYGTICTTFNPEGPTLFWSIMFAISKIFELGDTVFLVLRKKPVIFLHYFHHMLVMVIVFSSIAEMSAPSQIFMLMNYVAHSIMYPYYAIMAAGIRVPRPIAKCITTVQITQMFLGVYVTSFVVYKRDFQGIYCQQTRFSTLLAYGTYVAFGYLFVKFFIKAYSKKPAKKEA